MSDTPGVNPRELYDGLSVCLCILGMAMLAVVLAIAEGLRWYRLVE